MMKTIATLFLVSSSAALASNPRPLPGAYRSCPQAPSLRCANGSVCKKGEAKFDAKHDHLNLQTHESGFYCECMDGFIGHECTIQVQDCENEIGYSPSDPTGILMHSCYHGSTCKNFGSGNTCDCDELNSSSAPDAKKYAGLMCEHESTAMCAVSLIGFSAPNHQFCTNHGQCKKEVLEGAPHPKCDCREGWTGDHCELRGDVFASNQRQNTSGMNGVGGKVLFSFLIIALIVVVGGAVVLAYSTIKKNRGPREKAVGGTTAADVGVGDIEMDGSLIFPTASSNGGEGDDAGDGEADVEDLTLKEEKNDEQFQENAASGTDHEFTISDSQDDDNDDDQGSGSDAEQEII